jgi:hypothetical protein
LDADKNETLKYAHVLASQLLHLVCRAESMGRKHDAFIAFIHVVETYVISSFSFFLLEDCV